MNYFIAVVSLALISLLVITQESPTQEIAFVQPIIINLQNSVNPQTISNSISPQVIPQIQIGSESQIKIQHQTEKTENQHILSQQQILKRAKEQEDRIAQAQQIKKAYLQREKQALANKQEQEMKKLQSDGQISKTQKKRQQQRSQFKRQAKNVQPGTKFTQHLFQLTTTAQFLLKLPVNQQVALNLFTYISEDNTYVRTKDIQTEVPVKIFVYEDNTRVVFQGEFYYQIYITFQGKQNSIYTIRTFNEGPLKLISMSIKKLIQDSHVQQSITDELAKFHSKRTENLALQIHKWFLQFRRLAVLDFQDMKQIQSSVKKYYLYEIVQTFTGIILCFIQVKMIQKMLKGNTII